MLVVVRPIAAPIALLEVVRDGVVARTLVLREGLVPAAVITALSAALRTVQ